MVVIIQRHVPHMRQPQKFSNLHRAQEKNFKGANCRNCTHSSRKDEVMSVYYFSVQFIRFSLFYFSLSTSFSLF